MALLKFKHLIEVYKNRGALPACAAVISVLIKKCIDKYRDKKADKIIKNTATAQNKKEIILDINDYKLLLNRDKKGIHRELIINRIREPQATEAFKKIIKKGDVVLEAGANIGYYTILESLLVGDTGLIYAVEPANENFDYLRNNIEINNCKNVMPYKLALGSQNGDAVLNIYDFENWNTIEDISYVSKRGQEIVRVMTIDAFLKDKKKPSFIRMDVEGYELEILKGMLELLKETPPRGLFIEIHFYIMGKKNSLELLNILKENGYEVARYFLDKRFSPKIFLLDYLLERLDRIKDKLPIFYGEVHDITIDDLINNKNNLGSGSPEIFFELKKLNN